MPSKSHNWSWLFEQNVRFEPSKDIIEWYLMFGFWKWWSRRYNQSLLHLVCASTHYMTLLVRMLDSQHSGWIHLLHRHSCDKKSSLGAVVLVSLTLFFSFSAVDCVSGITMLGYLTPYKGTPIRFDPFEIEKLLEPLHWCSELSFQYPHYLWWWLH